MSARVLLKDLAPGMMGDELDHEIELRTHVDFYALRSPQAHALLLAAAGIQRELGRTALEMSRKVHISDPFSAFDLALIAREHRWRAKLLETWADEKVEL